LEQNSYYKKEVAYEEQRKWDYTFKLIREEEREKRMKIWREDERMKKKKRRLFVRKNGIS